MQRISAIRVNSLLVASEEDLLQVNFKQCTWCIVLVRGSSNSPQPCHCKGFPLTFACDVIGHVSRLSETWIFSHNRGDIFVSTGVWHWPLSSTIAFWSFCIMNCSPNWSFWTMKQSFNWSLWMLSSCSSNNFSKSSFDDLCFLTTVIPSREGWP